MNVTPMTPTLTRIPHLLTGLLFLLASCSVNKARIDQSPATHFQARQAEGCFSLLDNATGEVTVYNMSWDTLRFTPGNTFHIPLSLFALESGISPSEKTLFSVSAADTSASIQTGFSRGYPGPFATIARRLGRDTLQQWLDSIGYGNRKLGVAPDSSWIDGSLRISPDEQLGLMKKLYFDQLPFRQSVQEKVRTLMHREDNSAYRLSFQSAAVADTGRRSIGWTLGWIEENRHVYFFVVFIRTAAAEAGAEAEAVLRNILRDYGFFQGKK